ncbi:hypothetical protein RRG08_021275 [Elysia crispata]|uniref:Uncharacterized protein n=1 Tax=Elysia crispata TaxID=231223 RepID=A0AAE0ZBF9_9GAST|nr:hypothetical protein RRG08_021275 [Elysia crispata]
MEQHLPSLHFVGFIVSLVKPTRPQICLSVISGSTPVSTVHRQRCDIVISAGRVSQEEPWGADMFVYLDSRSSIVHASGVWPSHTWNSIIVCPEANRAWRTTALHAGSGRGLNSSPSFNGTVTLIFSHSVLPSHAILPNFETAEHRELKN